VESGVETSDRFMVFVCDQFLPYTLSELVKTITSKHPFYKELEFEDRTKSIPIENG
jgi:hypothetical protein